ncbi:MAG: hypothetical protein K2P04_07990 [Oscillospiraceae bacterium]|nr:hypothetical protein [Oscillospiraceae bacterium]
MEAKNQSAKRWLVPMLLGVIIVLLAVVLIVFLGRKPETLDTNEADAPKLGYAEGVTVVDDPDALQKAVDEMYAKAAEGTMALEYQNDANSEDGKTFSCYIANAVANSYDMYIDIYADQALTDEIYLSGLVRPGSAFREITLENALEPGTHRVYVAFTQVEEDLTTIHGQVMVTMDFIVAE